MSTRAAISYSQVVSHIPIINYSYDHYDLYSDLFLFCFFSSFSLLMIHHTNITWDINVQGCFECSHSYQRVHIYSFKLYHDLLHVATLMIVFDLFVCLCIFIF